MLHNLPHCSHFLNTVSSIKITNSSLSVSQLNGDKDKLPSHKYLLQLMALMFDFLFYIFQSIKPKHSVIAVG